MTAVDRTDPVLSQIVAQEYTGPESLRDAADLRERMAATVDLARRARVDARAHLWHAREAERALGRLILAAREAGDLTKAGAAVRWDVNLHQLEDYGISHQLGAHAVSLARVPDELWAQWREQDAEPTQAAVGKSARTYAQQLVDVREQAEQRRDATRRAEQARRERLAAIEAEYEQMIARNTPPAEPSPPPLTDEETDVSAVDFVLPAAAVDEPTAADERDPVGDEWLRLFRRIEQLVGTLDDALPALPEDRFADLTVMSARDLGRRVVDAAALWVRHVNAQYTERIER